MTTHGGDRVAAVLAAHGVPFLFTLCGGHISPILAAAKARGIRIVDTRDEATAVFAADAVARLTGTPGVAAVTAGPGLANTITALKNAQLAQSPLLLLAGAAPTALQGRGALQDIAQRPMAMPHVKLMRQVKRVAELGPAVADALAAARAGVPGPVVVECPVDVLYDEALIRGWYADAAGKGTSIADRMLRWYLNRHAARLFGGAGPVTAIPPHPVAVPEAGHLEVAKAADAFARAERPLIVVGSQAVVESKEAPNVAAALESLGVPVYLSGMARGLLGPASAVQKRHVRRQALRESDCVLLAGVPCDFRLDYGKHVRRSARLVAANRSPHDARLNRRPSITALGDAGRFIAALAREVGERARRPDWQATLADRDAKREAEIDVQERAASTHVNPVRLLRAIDRVAGAHAIFVADGGDFVGTASYILRPRGPLAWLDPGAFGTLGVGAGFAIGAALARPNAEVWLIWGDGASGYGLAELDTFARHGIPVIAVVGNDASWSQIAREQVKMLGDDVGTVLARTAYHEVARGFGAEGLELRDDAAIENVLARARDLARAGRPVLVNAWLGKSDFREGSLSM